MIFRTFLRERERLPLKEALRLVDEAVAILERHWRDKSFVPSKAELAQAETLQIRLAQLAAWARRLSIRLDRRFHGEPEVNDGKWNR